MGITSIGDQLTPGRPVEITFAAQLGLPSATQEICLIGRKHATSGSAVIYTVTQMNNVSDVDLATSEANTKFGAGSEAAKMVIACVTANAAEGRSNFPTIKVVPLASTDVDFGPSDAALTAVKRIKAEFIVSPFDAMNATLTGKLKDCAATMSGAARVENNQYGSIGIAANRNTADPSTLTQLDTQYLSLAYLRDSGSPVYSLGELAAAYAGVIAGNPVPFNPNDSRVMGGVAAPASIADYLSIGAGLDSETVLTKGWTPMRVLPTGDVAIVRARTGRTTTNGVTLVTAYYDVEDFQVLYFWRKTVYARLTQPDLLNVKASAGTATLIKGELIRLAQTFEDQGMFQAVTQLAKEFIVQRSTSDRHRFDVLTPVNVIPGLHVVATNVQATTEFDTLTV